ncbi:MAG: hypothetical protein ACI93N_001837, partial [Flavobacteriaceae bacterium]
RMLFMVDKIINKKENLNYLLNHRHLFFSQFSYF